MQQWILLVSHDSDWPVTPLAARNNNVEEYLIILLYKPRSVWGNLYPVTSRKALA